MLAPFSFRAFYPERLQSTRQPRPLISVPAVSVSIILLIGIMLQSGRCVTDHTLGMGDHECSDSRRPFRIVSQHYSKESPKRSVTAQRSDFLSATQRSFSRLPTTA